MKFIKKKMFMRHVNKMHGEMSTKEEIKGETKFCEDDDEIFDSESELSEKDVVKS